MIPGQVLTIDELRALPDKDWHVGGKPARNSKRAKRALITLAKGGLPVIVLACSEGVLEFFAVGFEYSIPLE